MLDKAPELDQKPDPWNKVNVVADLTERQRKEDSDAKEEAKKKNSERSEEEAKNWLWKVVGARGQRRAVKARVPEEEQEEQGHRDRLRSNRRE